MSLCLRAKAIAAARQVAGVPGLKTIATGPADDV
jgi:hypothetical protein